LRWLEPLRCPCEPLNRPCEGDCEAERLSSRVVRCPGEGERDWGVVPCRGGLVLSLAGD